MSKLEVIAELQQMLQSMRTIAKNLDKGIVCLKEVLDAEAFIPTVLSNEIRDCLDQINKKQVEFNEKYQKLNNHKPSEKYIVLESEFEESRRILEENNKQISAIKFFLSIHSKDEAAECVLQKRKEKLAGLDFDNIDTKIAEPYILLQEAYSEEDIKKKFSLVYRLAAHFEEEIVTGIQFSTLFSRDETISVSSGVPNEKETVGQDQQEFYSDTEKGENEDVATNGDVEDDSQKLSADELLTDKKLEDLYTKESNHILAVQETEKSKKGFGVKEFKSDITKQYSKEKIACLVEAVRNGGYTIEGITIKKNVDAKLYENVTEKLLQAGYLKKYIVKNLGEFFSLSTRGENAFKAKDSLSFINQHCKEKVSLQEMGEHIKDSANSAIVRLMMFDSIVKQRFILPDYIFLKVKNIIGTDFFSIGYSTLQDNTIWHIGIVSENPKEFYELKESLNEVVSKNDILIVYGLTLESAELVKNWLVSEINIECSIIGITVLLEKTVVDADTKAVLVLDDSEETHTESFSAKTANEELEKNETKKFSFEPEKVEEDLIELTDTERNQRKDIEESGIEQNFEENNRKNTFSATEEIVAIAEEGILRRSENDIECAKSSGNIIQQVAISLSDEEKEAYIAQYHKFIISGKTYAASAYLKVLTRRYSYFEPHYRQLAYAVNDPMAGCTYSSDTIFNVYYGEFEPISDYYIVAAAIRNFFFDQYSYDYFIQQVYAMVSGNRLFANNASLEKVVYELMTFKNEQHVGMDRYADYREKERSSLEKRLVEIRREAKEYYDNYGNGNLKENASHKRFIETTKLILGAGSDLCEYLKVVADNDEGMLDMLVEFLTSTYIKDHAAISEENIDPAKINKSLDYFWDCAAQNMRLVKKTSDLMGSLRMNLYKKVYKVVSVLCSYISVMKSCVSNTDDESWYVYKKIRTPLLNAIKGALEEISTTASNSLGEEAGKSVLLQTLHEVELRLLGNYQEDNYKYYYIDFLKNDKILLDENYLPILDEVPEIKEFSVLSRIQLHCEQDEMELFERLQNIFSGGDDYGSAELILKYLQHTGIVLSPEELERYNVKKAIIYPLRDLENKRKEFIEDIELAQSYGQIDNTVENSKELILQIVESWYNWAIDTKNYGFFVKILEEFRKKIKKDAQSRAQDLQKSLDVYLNENSSWEEDDLVNKAVIQIQDRIEQQNYAAAEDLLNRVITNDLDLENSVEQEDYLAHFLDEYDVHYKKTANSGATLKSLVNTSKNNKDIRGGNRLLENWPRGAGVGESTLKALLSTLGFNLGTVHAEEPIQEKIENYTILLKRPQNGRKSNYKHPISAFGSEAEIKGFRVVCVFGKTDATRLIDLFKEVGNAKNTIVLLDYALSLADRRTLARKTKTDMSGKVFAVIDRVVLLYLAKHYNETAISRMLMSIVMPFAAYQPYVEKSADVMPQEIFIGRKYELEKIESPTGVNIVYGGRQLGKSALLRMAKKDIDQDENGDRAILVDIKGIDYKAAAKKISAALYDEGILDQEHITDDWSELARDIKNRLRSETNPIPYLLLLMDEADTFIESCEGIGYQPFDALKDIQSIGSGRFKFVVAGLRNIVRFKREAALGNNSVLTHLESLTVTPFKAMEARELLEVPLSYLGFRFPKDNETDVLVSTIFGTTNYFPGLLQLYCAKLIEAMRRDYAGYSESETPPYIVKKDHIKKVLAEQSLQQDIREKFFITLKVGEDDYYYIIALLVAYHYHEDKSQNGASVVELLEVANTFSIGKIVALNSEKVEALMEEMCELNVLQHTGNGRYRFTRHSFCQMMGTVQQIEDELMNYMED